MAQKEPLFSNDQILIIKDFCADWPGPWKVKIDDIHNGHPYYDKDCPEDFPEILGWHYYLTIIDEGVYYGTTIGWENESWITERQI